MGASSGSLRLRPSARGTHASAPSSRSTSRVASAASDSATTPQPATRPANASTISSATVSACAIPRSGPAACASPPASSKRGANMPSERASSAPECTGPSTGAALLRWRPNQSLRRRRGRRQLDPSRRGEERRRVRWPTVLLSSATDGGLPLVLARFVRGLSTHQGSGCPRRLRTSATAAKCHRGPVDSHRVADQMPTGPSMSRRRAPHAGSPLPRG